MTVRNRTNGRIAAAISAVARQPPIQDSALNSDHLLCQLAAFKQLRAPMHQQPQ
jgi:hypothetical protein